MTQPVDYLAMSYQDLHKHLSEYSVAEEALSKNHWELSEDQQRAVAQVVSEREAALRITLQEYFWSLGGVKVRWVNAWYNDETQTWEGPTLYGEDGIIPVDEVDGLWEQLAKVNYHAFYTDTGEWIWDLNEEIPYKKSDAHVTEPKLILTDL